MKRFIKVILLLSIIIFVFVIFKDNIYNFYSAVFTSINRTLLEEERYKLILSGLKSTIIISFISIFLGSVLGFILFIMKISKFKILNLVSNIFTKLMQGIPITVLLLIFYFVLFGSISVEPIIVAIITFSIYFSAYMSELFRGAYYSINRNQIVSAYSLGFTKIQTIQYIVFPQIIVYILPVFKNESVSLIKLTSIVGYISIMDLTKAGDIIRNRTYEAFCPLIVVALIYFIICLLLSKLLDLIYKKIAKRKVVT